MVQPSLHEWSHPPWVPDKLLGRAGCGQSPGAGRAWVQAEPRLCCPVAGCHVELRGTRVTAPSAGEALPCFTGFAIRCRRTADSQRVCPPPGTARDGLGSEGCSARPLRCTCLLRSNLIPGYCRPKLHLVFCPGTFLPPGCSCCSPMLPQAHSPPQPAPQFAPAGPWQRRRMQGERKGSLFLPALSQSPLSPPQPAPPARSWQTARPSVGSHRVCWLLVLGSGLSHPFSPLSAFCAPLPAGPPRPCSSALSLVPSLRDELPLAFLCL